MMAAWGWARAVAPARAVVGKKLGDLSTCPTSWTGGQVERDLEEGRAARLGAARRTGGQVGAAFFTDLPCRHCGAAIGWSAPGGLAFADGSVAHLGCYEATEAARLLAAAKRAVASPDALTAEAELLARGVPLP